MRAVPLDQLPVASSTKTCRYDMSADNHGYCCQPDELVKTGNDDRPLLCQPMQPVPSSMMKHHAEINGEFVALVNYINQRNVADYTSLDKCLRKLEYISPSDIYKYLTSADGTKITVFELKMILSPTIDSGLTSLVQMETSEYTTMFTERCYNALYSSRDDTEASSENFFAEAYYNLPECSFPTCTMQSGVRWNRNSAEGGCVKGILRDGPYYTDNHSCALIYDPMESDIRCRYDHDKLKQLQSNIKDCWKAHESARHKFDFDRDFRVNPMSLVNQFCLSSEDLQLDDVEASDQEQIAIYKIAQSCPG